MKRVVWQCQKRTVGRCLGLGLWVLGSVGLALVGCKKDQQEPVPATGSPTSVTTPTPAEVPQNPASRPPTQPSDMGSAQPGSAVAAAQALAVPADWKPTTVSMPGTPDLPADWLSKVSETLVNDEYQAIVLSPWGKMTIKGRATGADGVAARYWTAFATGDFRAVFPYASGDMKERLAASDNEAGRKIYFEGINQRLQRNPMTEVVVEPLTVDPNGKAMGLVKSKRKDNTEEWREIELVQTPDGWRYSRIRLQQ